MAAGQDKSPFDRLVSAVSPALLHRQLGVPREGSQKVTFDPGLTKLRTVIKAELHYDLEKFGTTFLLLPGGRVSELMSAADGDRGQQIDYLLLAWAESKREEATVEALLRALYAADDTQAVENVARELRESGVTFQRDIQVPKRLSYADSVGIMPSPPTQVPPQKHFLENDEMELPQRLARLSMKTNMVPQRVESQSEMTPVELPPDVSLQIPLEETSLSKLTMAVAADPQSEGDDHDTSAQMPVEESWVVATSAVMSSTFESPQQVAAAVGDPTFEETHGHEMVSGDRRLERMQSDIEDLRKNMRKMETEMEKVQSEQRRESLYHSEKNKEWEAKLRQLEEENKSLTETVAGLREDLMKTNHRLQEALEKVARLEVDNEDLRQENQRLAKDNETLVKENDSLNKKVADTEREKAEFQDTLEKHNAELRDCKQRYEKELRAKDVRIETLLKESQKPRNKDATDSPTDNGQRLQVISERENKRWIWKDHLGAGGFGEVFLAQRKGSSELCAAKRMTFEDSATIEKQSEIMSSFIKEMKALQECNHPRVVRYIDRVIETDESTIHFYIIMEYMSKGSLADVLKREGKLEELMVKRYTRQLLEGLKYLHRRNVIHRDIKCSNILMDDNGDIKLADFGCVKFSGSKMSSGEHMTGTAWWMAPELVPRGNQSGAASEKSDVWSVGATVVEMLTGKRPFYEYEEKMAVIFGLGMGKLSLDKLICGPGFSDEVQEFLRLCINWEPSKRATVDALLGTPFCSLE